MPRTGMRRALSGIAAATLAVAGGLAASGPALAAGSYALLILPDQGESAIYNVINSATSSIDVTMYELRDTTVEADLVNRAKAGVSVRVILDAAHKSVNSTAFRALQSGGVGVTYSSSAFTYTHQKTITVDGDESYISTGNLDTPYYPTSRDYGVFDTNAADVAAIVKELGAAIWEVFFLVRVGRAQALHDNLAQLAGLAAGSSALPAAAPVRPAAADS